VIDGRAQASGIRRPASDATLLLVLNAHHDVVNFKLPDVPEGERWTCLLDTNMPVRPDLPQFSAGDEYQVTARSLLLFALEAPSRATQRVFDRLEQQLTSDESEAPPTS
jgi:glycogen operon protein